MSQTALTFSDIRKYFPDLRPSQLDYLVREGKVKCARSGRGRPRIYPVEALKQIESYLRRTCSADVNDAQK